MYEQDRRDTDMGRDLDEKAAVGPRRRYESTTRLSAPGGSAVPTQANGSAAPATVPVPRRRHRYADEPTAETSTAVPASPPVPANPADSIPALLPPPEQTAAPAQPAPAAPAMPTRTPEPDTRTEAARALEDSAEEVDRAQLNRIAEFFRGAQHEKAKGLPAIPKASPTSPNVWDTGRTRELRTYTPDLTGANGTGTDLERADDDERVLLAVRELPGVHDAGLYTDATGTRRLRLDLDSAADPDAVSAEAARLLADRRGVRAKPRTTQQYAVPRRVPVSANRAVVEHVQVSTSGFETAVEVALNVDGQRAIGRAAGPAVDWHVLRTAADATIDAVAGLMGNRGRAVVEHASVVPAGALRVAVVVVLLLTEAGAEQLAGAAPVSGDNRQAMVHATMSALNRRLEVLLP